jgi:hypothetical protein
MAAATTPLTYNGYVTQIGTMAVVGTTTSSGVVVGVDTAFNNIIPQMLNYAELRIQRDLDLLPSQTINTYSLTQNVQTLQISIDDFVTVQTVAVTASGVPTPLLPVSKEYLQNVYPSASGATIPQYFAVYGSPSGDYGKNYQNIIVGPWPDSAYSVSITGTARLPSLYTYANAGQAATSTTFISTYLPDLLIMASMIYISAFQRNFGRQSDDPAMAQSYESQYQALLRGALPEEYRKKFQASAWSSQSSSPVATPTRG